MADWSDVDEQVRIANIVSNSEAVKRIHSIAKEIVAIDELINRFKDEDEDWVIVLEEFKQSLQALISTLLENIM